MAKAPKATIGAGVSIRKTRNKRRSAPKPRRHSKTLGPKSDMKRDRGRQ